MNAGGEINRHFCDNRLLTWINTSHFYQINFATLYQINFAMIYQIKLKSFRIYTSCRLDRDFVCIISCTQLKQMLPCQLDSSLKSNNEVL